MDTMTLVLMMSMMGGRSSSMLPLILLMSGAFGGSGLGGSGTALSSAGTSSLMTYLPLIMPGVSAQGRSMSLMGTLMGIPALAMAGMFMKKTFRRRSRKVIIYRRGRRY